MTNTSVPHAAPSDAIDTYVRNHLADNAALYDLDLEALQAAAPDVVVSQTLCDVCAVSTGDVVKAIETLPSKPALIDLDPKTLDEVLDDVRRVGESLGRGAAGAKLLDALRTRRAAVAGRTAGIKPEERPRVAFLEWLMPPFTGGHWIPDMIALAGGTDLFGAPGEPSRSATWQQVAAGEPDVLFIACCGFTRERALEDTHAVLEREICRDMAAVRSGKVLVADGDSYFSRPGPRLVDGLEIMAHALHPHIHPPSTRGSCDRVGL